MSYSQQARPFQKPADHRTAYDKSFKNFYDPQAYNAKSFPTRGAKSVDASENELDVTEGYVAYGNSYPKSVVKEYRTAYDKSFNQFYDQRAQNAKTLPSSGANLIDKDRS